MTLTTKLFTGFLIGFSMFCSAQMETYNYKRTLNTITDEWHKITLPDAVFGRLNSDLSDIRIYGITKMDTIEAPYFLQVAGEKLVHKTIPFEIVNRTKSNNYYYFTFQLNSDAVINQINLDFNDRNFDWRIELEGSQNQQEWFTILEDYRILSIKNESINFKFTKLVFPEAKYLFYRLKVKHNEQPDLSFAQLSEYDTTKINYVNHKIKNLETIDDKIDKTTIINLELEQAVPLSQLNIEVSDTFDYYRPLKIEYKNDSTKTEKGWKYNYKTITSGTLNSLEANGFKFSNTIAKHLRITIFNGDNQPLSIAGVSAQGYQFNLVARFTEPADYMLVYKNPFSRQPNYDINQFESQVPKDLKKLIVGEENVIPKREQKQIKPLFENSYWLWGIIGLVILVLGGFTLRMLRQS